MQWAVPSAVIAFLFTCHLLFPFISSSSGFWFVCLFSFRYLTTSLKNSMNNNNVQAIVVLWDVCGIWSCNPIPSGFDVLDWIVSVRTSGLISWRKGKVQVPEQLDPSLEFSFLYFIYFLTLSSNFPGWVDFRHSKVLKKTPNSELAMPGRCVLWILSSSQLFLWAWKLDWPGKWPNSFLLMTLLQQKRCVGRQVVSSWGGGGMHHLLFKQKHLFGMLSILSVRAWTRSSQERLDIVISTSGGRLLCLPACLEKNNLLNLLGAIAVRTRATVTWEYSSHKWMK